jgi:two-component system CheB/CheR fusion protein
MPNSVATSDQPVTDDVAISTLQFPIVGIGASAGGIEAVRRFFEHMPADCGMAFVIILHLSPVHESNVDHILERVTRMPVLQVTSDVPIEKNHIYVISPALQLEMTDGHLRVSPADRPPEKHIAIDLFFRTLGEAHRERAFAIVLSGTGADGTAGLTRVKERGGLTFAQNRNDAQFDDMPRNAVESGAVDFVLPVAEIPQKLVDLWAKARRIEIPLFNDMPSSSSPPSAPAKAHAADAALAVASHGARFPPLQTRDHTAAHRKAHAGG